MITGRLADLATQQVYLPSAMQRALAFLHGQDLHTLGAGRHEIEGEQIFLLVQDMHLQPAEVCRAEIHRSYADIQIPVSSAERYGVAQRQPELQPAEDLFAVKDAAFHPAPPNEFFMDLQPGEFAVFFPGEWHRPCIAIDEMKPLRKAVIKVHVSLLGD